jgi:AcrR family transcriptional regulator
MASLERMLAAAEQLVLERGSEDFTLQEVSQTGNVSIGSIYLRFDSKDSLVRAVIGKEIERIGEEEERVFTGVSAQAKSLAELVPAFVSAYAEILRRHAPLLRVAMERAAYDPLVSGPGKARAYQAEALNTETLLKFRHEFGGSNPEIKAAASHHIIYATLARQLSLGSNAETTEHYDWELLKAELGRMCLAYLRADD